MAGSHRTNPAQLSEHCYPDNATEEAQSSSVAPEAPASEKLSKSPKRKPLGWVAKAILPRHKRMSRMMGYCLMLDTPWAWQCFGEVAIARLSTHERVSLAFAALKALDWDLAEMTVAALVGSAGCPLPAFLGGMEDARLSASWASNSELKA